MPFDIWCATVINRLQPCTQSQCFSLKLCSRHKKQNDNQIRTWLSYSSLRLGWCRTEMYCLSHTLVCVIFLFIYICCMYKYTLSIMSHVDFFFCLTHLVWKRSFRKHLFDFPQIITRRCSLPVPWGLHQAVRGRRHSSKRTFQVLHAPIYQDKIIHYLIRWEMSPCACHSVCVRVCVGGGWGNIERSRPLM